MGTDKMSSTFKNDWYNRGAWKSKEINSFTFLRHVKELKIFSHGSATFITQHNFDEVTG